MAKVIPIPIGPIYTGGCRGVVHVVQQGDTLYRLGKQYHVSVSSIMYANPYVNIYNLQVGDELCIPVAAPVPPAPMPVPLPAEPAPQPMRPTPRPAEPTPQPMGPMPRMEVEEQQEIPRSGREYAMEEEDF